MTLGLPFARVADCPAHVVGLARSPTRLWCLLGVFDLDMSCLRQYFELNFEAVPACGFGGRLGRSTPSPYSLELCVEPTGDAETSILGWESLSARFQMQKS